MTDGPIRLNEVARAAGPVRATTVLWDIDGTLVSSGGVAAGAFLDAVAEVTGRRPSPERRDYGGRLDPEIADMLLAAVGAAPTQVADVLAALERLVAERLGELRAQTRAYPGVAALVATGGRPAGELAGLGADIVLPDLSDPRPLLDLWRL